MTITHTDHPSDHTPMTSEEADKANQKYFKIVPYGKDRNYMAHKITNHLGKAVGRVLYKGLVIGYVRKESTTQEFLNEFFRIVAEHKKTNPR